MNVIRYFQNALDRIAGFLVGETKQRATVPDHSPEGISASPAAKSPMTLEDSHPMINPFESAPSVEEVFPPAKKATSAKTAKPAQVSAPAASRGQINVNRASSAGNPVPAGFKTKNTIKARQIDSRPKENLAGMKTRKSGESVSDDKIVQNETNDTVYSQRNEVVKVVYDRYAKFGDTIASAILSKTFLPNGLALMLTRLEIESLGSPLPDHDQVVDWIDENGTDEFCKRMKIRT